MMKSKKAVRFRRSSKKKNDAPPENPSDPASGERNRREGTVYDAVAGRLNYKGFIPLIPSSSKYRDTTWSSTRAVPPDEALFRRERAPVRYAENDIYAQDRHLGPDQTLPDSDMLEIVHRYASDFYAAMPPTQRPLRQRPQKGSPPERRDFLSMDETALLAMGILLEEAAAECLGKTGHLALTEPDADLSHRFGGCNAVIVDAKDRKRRRKQRVGLEEFHKGDGTSGTHSRQIQSETKRSKISHAKYTGIHGSSPMSTRNSSESSYSGTSESLLHGSEGSDGESSKSGTSTERSSGSDTAELDPNDRRSNTVEVSSSQSRTTIPDGDRPWSDNAGRAYFERADSTSDKFGSFNTKSSKSGAPDAPATINSNSKARIVDSESDETDSTDSE